jgi:hypothetical protein
MVPLLAAVAVHREAHGLLADRIYEVQDREHTVLTTRKGVCHV